jgi:hypothetical protein
MAVLENPPYAWPRAFLSLDNIPLDQKSIFEQDSEVLGHGDDPDEGYKQFFHSSLKSYQKRTLRDNYLQYRWTPDSAAADRPQERESIWDSMEETRKLAASEFRPAQF